ncbi:MAG: hypothetical protein KatS3mg105_4228 [Gemmatales bacterium]|nr:MAG: hypothetical protein KatS3mg105_4228 [Gemmatales bacterium]
MNETNERRDPAETPSEDHGADDNAEQRGDQEAVASEAGGFSVGEQAEATSASEDCSATRRGFLTKVSSAAMLTGLAASYGTLAVMAGKFLYVSRPLKKAWLYVTSLDQLRPGEAMSFVMPTGQRISLRRRGKEGTADDFLALSSVCPHLGCRVHWEVQNNRYFCPCHNGVFTPEGVAVAGPPADAGQSLFAFPIKVENGLVFVEAPIE